MSSVLLSQSKTILIDLAIHKQKNSYVLKAFFCVGTNFQKNTTIKPSNQPTQKSSPLKQTYLYEVDWEWTRNTYAVPWYLKQLPPRYIPHDTKSRYRTEPQQSHQSKLSAKFLSKKEDDKFSAAFIWTQQRKSSCLLRP